MSGRLVVAAAFALGCSAPTYAHADIFEHVEPQSGVVILSNVQRRQTGVLTPKARPPAAAIAAERSTPDTRSPNGLVHAAKAAPPDDDRRSILLGELSKTKAAMSTALAAGAPPEVIVRHQGDIAALEREIQRVH